MARLAPHWGAEVRTWDELGADADGGGPWLQRLLTSAIGELTVTGVIAPVTRDALAHLSRDWDAQAAGIERAKMSDGRKAAASTLRWCAAQLRSRIDIRADT